MTVSNRGKIKDGTPSWWRLFNGGGPETLIKALLEKSTAKNLTVVSNDTGVADSNMIKVMKEGRVTRVIQTISAPTP